MVLWQRLVRVLPSGIPAGIPDSVGFRNKFILPWNDLIPTCIPQNPKSSTETGGFQKMRPGRNRNKKQNAQPIFSVLLQMSHPLGSHLLHSQTVLAQKLLLMGGAEGINQAEIICPPSPLSSSDVCCLPPLPHGSCTLCW